MPPYLTPAGTYDRSAILLAAWALARREVVAAARTIGPFKGRITTARAEFPAALRRIWAEAKSRRAYAEWAAEHDADTARQAALPARERAIEAAHRALTIAEHADSFTAASNAAVASARAQLAALSLHA